MFSVPSFKHHLHATRPPQDANFAGNAIAFHYGRERGVVLEDVDETQLLLLSLLDGRHTFAAIVSRLQSHDPAVTAEDVAEVLDDLAQYGLLEDAAISPPPVLTATDIERYESQLRFFSVLDQTGTQRYEMQARLKRARVTVLGLGGLGSNVLMGLAAIGVGFIRAVDFDVVELGNLNRQILYEVADIKQAKVLAAMEHLRRFNPEVHFEPVDGRIDGVEHIIELVEGTDLVALCADLPPAIDGWMNEASLKSGIPYIRGGYRGSVAEVGPFVIPFKTSCVTCRDIGHPYIDVIDELAWINEQHWLRHPNIHFVVASAANLICSEICKHITGLVEPSTYNHLYALDIEHFTMSALPWPRNEKCITCGHGSRSEAATSVASEQVG